MFSLLLALIYVSFISLGLPVPLLGSAWPLQMQESLGVSLSLGGVISCFLITPPSTILSQPHEPSGHPAVRHRRRHHVQRCLTALAFWFLLSNSFFALCLGQFPMVWGWLQMLP